MYARCDGDYSTEIYVCSTELKQHALYAIFHKFTSG